MTQLHSGIMYYLMIKVHNKTRLRYLCKKSTINRKYCYSYRGSGKYWKQHLRQHGDDITTFIIGEYKNSNDLRINGIYWSEAFNVVDSKEWANLIIEKGDGGMTWDFLSNEKQDRVRSILSRKNKHTSKKKRLANERRAERKRNGIFTENEKKWYKRLSEMRKGGQWFSEDAKKNATKAKQDPLFKKERSQYWRKRKEMPFSLTDGTVTYDFLNQIEACEKLNLKSWGVNGLISGLYKTHRGWRLAIPF